MRTLFQLLLFASLLTIEAATYYVAKSGLDTNPGTEELPWLTLTKAATTTTSGDSVIVKDGDYDEHIYETSHNVTYTAENEHLASLRAFRLGGTNITLSGLKLNRCSGRTNWGAAVRIEGTAAGAVITNCFFSDVPYAIASDFRFDTNLNQVISASSDFGRMGDSRWSSPPVSLLESAELYP